MMKPLHYLILCFFVTLFVTCSEDDMELDTMSRIAAFVRQPVQDGEKKVQKVRTSSAGSDLDTPANTLEKQADRMRGAYYLEGLTYTKKVALTFDDGPGASTTLVLDVLNDYGIKATFFQVGSNVLNLPDITKRVFDEGHTIANHTFSHPYLDQFDSEPFKSEEFDPTQEAIYNVIGKYPRLFRPPYGVIVDPHVKLLAYDGVKTILWSIDPWDWDMSRSDEQIIESVNTNLHEEAIVLLHVGSEKRNRTAKVLIDIIEHYQKEGYSFVTVDELLKVSPYL